MDKEQLLAEAKKRYPIGTKFKSAYIPSQHTIYEVTKNYYDFWLERVEHIVVNESSGPSIYYEGKWADILKYPKGYKKEEEVLRFLELY